MSLNPTFFTIFCLGFLGVGGTILSHSSELPPESELLQALSEDPSDDWALYNLGLLRYLEKDYFEAIELLGKLVELDPDDWQAREKFIQALSGAGQDNRVEEEIELLRESWASGEHELLVERGFFIRDQFHVGKHHVYAFQYFSMEGDRPVAWKFLWETEGVDADRWLSLGSYPSTTEIMRNNGDIGEDESAFHLDGYWKNGSHATYAFFRGRPEYGEVCEMVQKILTGKQKSISSSVPNGAPAIEE